MDKDKNGGFFSTRPNTRETLRQYSDHKRRKKTNRKPPVLESGKGKPTRAAKKEPVRDRVKLETRQRQRSRGRPRRFGFPGLGLALFFRRLRIPSFTVLASALVAMAAVAAGLWMLIANNAMEVFVDGEHVGFIAERDTDAADLAAQVETAIGITIGANVMLDQTITLEPTRAPSSGIIPRPDIIPIIRDVVTFKAEGFVIKVDGEEMGALRSHEAAESALNGIALRHVPDGAELVREPIFVEDVIIQSGFMSEDSFESPEVITARLSRERPVSREHIVQPGDSMYIIATRVGMTLEAIFAANPDINPSDPALSVGQSVNVVQMTPTISVRTVEVSVTNEDEPYGTEIISSPARPSTHRIVVQQGHNGVKEVTRHITRVNGVITNTEIISERIIQEPVNEQVEVGTRN